MHEHEPIAVAATVRPDQDRAMRFLEWGMAAAALLVAGLLAILH